MGEQRAGCVLPSPAQEKELAVHQPLTSHAAKRTRFWNHAMHSNAVGHAAIEDTAQNGSDGHGVFWKAESIWLGTEVA